MRQTHFFKIVDGEYLKVQAERPIIYILVYYLCSFSGVCKFRGALMCNEALAV